MAEAIDAQRTAELAQDLLARVGSDSGQRADLEQALERLRSTPEFFDLVNKLGFTPAELAEMMPRASQLNDGKTLPGDVGPDEAHSTVATVTTTSTTFATYTPATITFATTVSTAF